MISRTQGSTPLPNTGPTYDNTRENLAGSYVYLSESQLSQLLISVSMPHIFPQETRHLPEI